jgi:hypothetical protein
MKKLILVCLCLLSTCSCSISKVETEFQAISKGGDANGRFVHHWIEGNSVWEDRKLGVVCYDFGYGGHSCIQNRTTGSVE